MRYKPIFHVGFSNTASNSALYQNLCNGCHVEIGGFHNSHCVEAFKECWLQAFLNLAGKINAVYCVDNYYNTILFPVLIMPLGFRLRPIISILLPW